MSRNDLFILIFGIAVLLLVGGTFLVMLITYVKQKNKLVKLGQLDDEILQEYRKEQKTSTKVKSVFSRILDTIICVIFSFIIISSIVAGAKGNELQLGSLGTAKVVNSPSMALKHETNTYLIDNELNNQFDTYDVVFINSLPDEMELKLYDIVVYEKEGYEIIHRIINIEEPNEEHPDCRWFTLKGDSNKLTDTRPVLYSQMKGIYNSHKIPLIGLFVLWLQSVLGYLILFVVLFYIIGEPIVVRKMRKVRDERILVINESRGYFYTESPYKTPVLQILNNKYYLNDENSFEQAKDLLNKFISLLHLNKKEIDFIDFKFDAISGKELLQQGLIKTYSIEKPEEEIEHNKRDFVFNGSDVEHGRYCDRKCVTNVSCYHSFASRLLLCDPNIQHRFFDIKQLLLSFGIDEEGKWDKSIFRFNNSVIATFELDKAASLETNIKEDLEIDSTLKNLEEANLNPYEDESENSKNNFIEVTDNMIISDEEGKDGGKIILNEKEIVVHYLKSFTAKIIQADEQTKNNYNQLKNFLLSFNFKDRTSWSCETFRKNSNNYCKIAYKGKSLYVYLALNPSEFENSKYFIKNVADSKKYNQVPLLIKVRTQRSVKWAKELISIMAEKNGLFINNEYIEQDFKSKQMSTKDLIRNKLIRVTSKEKIDFSSFGKGN